jgi:membrane-bound inhibitor of C-type lysozyme
MFTAQWHNSGSKHNDYPKEPENSKTFLRLYNVIEFSRTRKGITFYVNWTKGNTGHLVRNGQVQETHKID